MSRGRETGGCARGGAAAAAAGDRGSQGGGGGASERRNKRRRANGREATAAQRHSLSPSLCLPSFLQDTRRLFVSPAYTLASSAPAAPAASRPTRCRSLLAQGRLSAVTATIFTPLFLRKVSAASSLCLPPASAAASSSPRVPPLDHSLPSTRKQKCNALQAVVMRRVSQSEKQAGPAAAAAGGGK